MAKSFIKKVAKTKVEALDKPVFDDVHKVVFVNPQKYKRAEVIVALVNGTRQAITDQDQERKDKFTRLIQEQGLDLKKDDVIPAVYELLGGLIRTPEEQKEIEVKAVEMQKRGKKKMIE